MHRWDPLNERQVTVLRLIASGDDLSEPEDIPHRRTASALRDRGLATISKRDGWHAKITDAGRYYLEHRRHPDHPDVRVSQHACRPSGDPELEPAEGTSGKTSPDLADNCPEPAARPRQAPPHRTARIAGERRTAAADLVATLLADGHLLIRRPDEEVLGEWRRIVDFIKRNGLAPAGKRVVKTRPYGQDLRIELVDGAHPNSRPDHGSAISIVVPEQVHQLHPLLRDLTTRNSRLQVSSDSLPRALRILHALLTEANRRGHRVAWTDDRGATIMITTSGYQHEAELCEEYDERDVLPSPDDTSAGRVYGWQRVQPQRRVARR
jgi:hypothetical protein